MAHNEAEGATMVQPRIDPFSGAQIRIGVMGAAGGDFSHRVLSECRRLGKAVAGEGCCLLTGACPGLPHEAVLGAKELQGRVMGISPATSLKEHVEVFGSPYKEYDILVYTGLGLMGRELVNIRSSDIIVVVGGRSGTLGEFAIAYEEGKLIGILSGSGGIADAIRPVIERFDKGTGAEVIYDPSPEELISRLVERYLAEEYENAAHPRARS
jgi:hypothetical protein